MRILKDLFEGLELRDHPKGHKEIYYNDDPNHPDDPRLAKFTSTKYPGFVQTSGSENTLAGAGTGTHPEGEEMKKAMKENPGVLQHRIPSFFGFVWEPGPLKSKKTGEPVSLSQFKNTNMDLSDEDKENILKYSEEFGHAVKDKSDSLKFDPESKKKLMQKGADNIIHQMRNNPNFKIDSPESYDQVIVIPMHSRSDLSRQFGEIITKSLKSSGFNNVHLGSKFAKKARSPDISSTKAFTKSAVSHRRNKQWKKVKKGMHGKTNESMLEALMRHPGTKYPLDVVGYEHNVGKKEDLTPKIWNVPLSLKNKSEDEIRQDFDNHFDDARKHMHKIMGQLKQSNLSPEERTRLSYALKSYGNLTNNEDKYRSTMEKRIKTFKNKGWSGKAETKNVPSIASDFSTVRGQTRNFANYDKKHHLVDKISDKGKKTLIVISDDNVDTGATTDDFYRKMFKDGMLHQGTDVVAAGLFKKAQSGRDSSQGFGKSLMSQKDQHEGKKGRARASTLKKPKITTPKKHDNYQIAKNQFNDWKDDPDYDDMRDDIVDDMVSSHGISKEDADTALKQVEKEHERLKNPPPTEKEAQDIMKQKIGKKAETLVNKRNDTMISKGFDPTFTKEKLFKNASKIMSQYIDAGHSKDDATKSTLKRLGIKESLTFIGFIIND